MYGKDNRVLYSAKFSQSFEVVPAKPSWEGAPFFNGGHENRRDRARLPTWRSHIALAKVAVKSATWGMAAAARAQVA
jgi:hypothetical protein